MLIIRYMCLEQARLCVFLREVDEIGILTSSRRTVNCLSLHREPSGRDIQGSLLSSRFRAFLLSRWSPVIYVEGSDTPRLSTCVRTGQAAMTWLEVSPS